MLGGIVPRTDTVAVAASALIASGTGTLAASTSGWVAVPTIRNGEPW